MGLKSEYEIREEYIEGETIQQLYKQTDLKNTMYMAAEAWIILKVTTLGIAWNNFFPSNESITAPEKLLNSRFVSELSGLIQESSKLVKCDIGNIQDLHLKCLWHLVGKKEYQF
ncbi:hypothetical protein NPIL_329651 [Nephila pilipes]|uniref:Uncharacterized protein n=1 Tax=Nephila pilipes TaxID=299642 RepID=A0A8X6P0W7_NEPPI|nr:hypothetical protein NPIL_329651 [Nephila pilipes]